MLAKLKDRPFLTKSLLASLCGILMFLAFPDYSILPLMWISQIPLLYALEGVSARYAFLLGVIAGTVVILGGFPWIAPMMKVHSGLFFPLDYIALFFFSLTSAFSFGAVMFVFQLLRRKNLLSDILWITSTIWIYGWNTFLPIILNSADFLILIFWMLQLKKPLPGWNIFF